MVLECLICCETVNFMTVGECNHKVVCLKCCLKMRALQQNYKCIYCNEELNQVAVIDEVEKNWNEMYKEMEEFKYGICYTDKRTKGACYYLDKFQCPIENCDVKDYFTKKTQYEFHLEKKHKKYLCELCVKYSTLLLNEQKTFTQYELKDHMNKGDFDKENNLIMLHPQCLFCNKHFFSDEEFKQHLNKKHEKCFLCKNQKYKWIYYRDYPSLEKHFEASHYSCLEQSCKQKGFQVFKSREELEKHNSIVHKKGQMNNNNDMETLMDNEGIDVSEWLLSEQKRQIEVEDESQMIEKYNKEFNIMKLFIHFIQEPSLSLKDEQKIIKEHYQNKNKGQQLISVPLDQVKFDLYNKKSEFKYGQFWDVVKKILKNFAVDKLKLAIKNYFDKKIDILQLFKEFREIFGTQLCYKYFYLYNLTLQGQRRTQAQNTLISQINQLYFVNKNILYDTDSWKKLFHQLVKEVSENILFRIKKQRINLKQKYNLCSGRIFQMVGTVKQISLKEAIQFKYLGNFLQNRNNLSYLQTIVTIYTKKIQQVLDKVNNVDILTIFIYINLITIRFEDKKSIVNAQKVNPNLLKLFMRHYPQLSKDEKYDLDSDEEDYEFQNQEQEYDENKGTIREIYDHKEEERQKSKYNQDKIHQVFTQNAVTFNPEDKFEFPDLDQTKKIEIEQKKDVLENGWNDLDSLTLQSNKQKKEKLEQEFPDLIEQTGNNRLNFTKTKSNQSKQPKIIKTISNPFEEKVSKGERNILSGLGNNTKNTGSILVTKKKKKKKKNF